MNNVFSFKRFGNYFLFDLRRAFTTYGTNLLVMSLSPAILFVIHLLLGLLKNGTASELPIESKFVCLSIVIFVVSVSAGIKIYGSITEKRFGSDFLMLPASSFEKWLSMAAVVCVVVPVTLSVVSIASDVLLSLIAPSAYGPSMTSHLLDADILGDKEIYINAPALLYLSWCGCALTFTLGGICFKKAKAAKTFLCLFVLTTIFTLLLAATIGDSIDAVPQLFEDLQDPEQLINFLNLSSNLFFAVTLGTLLILNWFRIRTIKH